MAIRVERQSGVHVLHVEGDLTAINAAHLQQVTGPLLSRSENEFVVDLAESPSIDSAGLESLTKLKRECEERLGALRLCGLDETCETILRITRLADEFDRDDSVEAAVASFG